MGKNRGLAFREDIEGLRGLAVASVLLFHFDLGMNGGFIGVDVFFVISGFLISGLILTGFESGHLSFSGFFVKRINRLLPAAAVMMFVVLTAGLFVLPPGRLLLTAKTALAQQFWAGNMYLWSAFGYFEAPAENNPFLHVWSLSVEEQFYAVYPLFLVSICRWKRILVPTIIGLLCFCSFALSVYGVAYHRSAAFYFLPTRAWEMLIGSFVWLMSGVRRPQQAVCEVMAWFAIATGLIYPAVAYSSGTSFPGFNALLPCVATGCLLWVGSDPQLISSKMLRMPVLRMIGRISYSLYLWHWPVIVFGRLMFSFSSIWDRLFLLGCSVVMAILSFVIVEAPLRKGGGRTTCWILLSLPIAVSVCLFIIHFDGLPSRSPESVAKYERAIKSRAFLHEVSYDQLISQRLPVFGSPNGSKTVLVWGDSHAMALIPGIDAACRRLNFIGNQVTHSSTPPLSDFVFRSEFGLGEQNPRFARAVFDYVRQKKVDIVIISAAWWSYSADSGFEEAVHRTIDGLVQLGVKVLCVLDVANHSTSPEELASRAWLRLPLPEFTTPHSVHVSRNTVANSVFVSHAGPEVRIVDPAQKLCSVDGVWLGEMGGVVYYRDDHHLSIEGSLLLKDMFFEALEDCFDTVGSSVE